LSKVKHLFQLQTFQLKKINLEIVIMLSRVAFPRCRFLSYSCRLSSKQTNPESVNTELASTQNPLKIRDVPMEYTNVQPEDFKTFEEYFPHSPFNLLGSGKVQ